MPTRSSSSKLGNGSHSGSSCSSSLPSAQPESSPLGIDRSPTTDLGTLVNLDGQLRSFLLPSCRRLGQEELNVAGTHAIDAGGFADVWMGKMGDQKVAVKSYRFYASANNVTTYKVSYSNPSTYFTHRQPTNRGFTVKRWHALVSPTSMWCHSSGSIPLESIHSPSFSSSWNTSTSACILETTAMSGRSG